MAKFLPGVAIAAARGQMGGTVFSQNRYGPYIRNNSSPTQPRTDQQQYVRAAMTLASQRWRDGLDDTKRNAWILYAQNTPISNVFGLRQILSGNAMYIRAAAFFLRFGFTPPDAGPTKYGEAPLMKAVLAGSTASGVTLTGDFGPIEGATHIQIQECAQKVSQTRNFFNGPWVHLMNILGSAAPPVTLRANTAVAVGDRWFYRFHCFTADGRVSPPSTFYVDITS